MDSNSKDKLVCRWSARRKLERGEVEEGKSRRGRRGGEGEEGKARRGRREGAALHHHIILVERVVKLVVDFAL